MAFASETSEPFPMAVAPQSLFRAPIGFISPLWALFSGAALTGVAFWWATQWMRPAAAISNSFAFGGHNVALVIKGPPTSSRS